MEKWKEMKIKVTKHLAGWQKTTESPKWYPQSGRGKSWAPGRSLWYGRDVRSVWHAETLSKASRQPLKHPCSSEESGNMRETWKWSHSVVSDSVTPWTVACQAPLSMGFSRQGYWSKLICPPSRGSSWPRDQTRVSCIGRWLLIMKPGKEASIWNVLCKLGYKSEEIWARLVG